MRIHRLMFVVALAGVVYACAEDPRDKLAALPSWTFEDATLFPPERGLVRPEDGIALSDGRILVVDQAVGLREIAPDGSMRPFGLFAEAGYAHEPPDSPAAANGIAVEPDGTHLLVCDMFTGAIYRVNVETEAVERIYTHAFGVNAVRRDRTGAIWFTQSTENPPGPDSEARMYAALDVPVADGALFRIPPAPAGEPLPAAQPVVRGLYFANGFVIDEDTGHLYLAETARDRVYAFHIGAATGELSDRRVIADVMTPDNVEIDEHGLVWIVSPARNEVIVVEQRTETARSVFRAGTPENDQVSAEWQRRGAAGEPRLEIMSPAIWAPLPGFITGVILAPDDGPVYLTGLGDTLVRLERQAR